MTRNPRTVREVRRSCRHPSVHRSRYWPWRSRRRQPPRPRRSRPPSYAGTLHISGSPSADRIALRLSALDPNLQVDVGDDGSADFTFDRGTFGSIDVAAGHGADAVRIDEADGVFATTEATRIDGGNGDNRLTGGSGTQVIIAGRGNDVVDGNQGADTAFLDRGDDTYVSDRATAPTSSKAGAATTHSYSMGSAPTKTCPPRQRRPGPVHKGPGDIVMDLDDVEGIEPSPKAAPTPSPSTT